VQFSEPVTDSALTKGNYAIDGGITISSVTRLAVDTVALTTSKMGIGTDYNLTINGIQDTASPANTIAAGTKVAFKSAVFQTGWATYERWQYDADPGAIDILDAALKDGSQAAPTVSTAVAQFECPWGVPITTSPASRDTSFRPATATTCSSPIRTTSPICI